MSEWPCGGCGGANPEAMRFCGHCGAARSGGNAPVDLSNGALEALRGLVTAPVAEKLLEGRGRLREERRLVTALFADISGFTELASTLDEERLSEVVDPLVARLSSVVGRYDGYIEKYAGDALLALFGAPVSHEDDPDRALMAALDLFAELDALRPELPPEAQGLRLHMGINSGHVVARMVGSDVRFDYAVLGESVILAQRLESAALAGSIYVGEATYQLTAPRWRFEPLGELTVKGADRPVRAWLLQGRAHHHRTAEGVVQAQRPLVGREAESTALEAALHEAVAGSGGVATIVGEAGAGKSRLLAHLRQHALDSGATWMEARSVAYGVSRPMLPWTTLLRRTFGLRLEDGPERAVPAVRDAMAGIGADFASDAVLSFLGYGADDPVAPSVRAGLVEALGVFARQSALVLALDDVHWADPASLELAQEIAAVAPEGRVLLLATARQDAAADLARLAGAVPAHRRLEIELLPLAGDQIEAVARNVLGGPLDPGLAAELHELAAGNPFFAGEIVRTLHEASKLQLSGGTWHAPGGLSGIPPTVEEVISARLDRLPVEERRLLEAAAVMGRHVRIGLLRAVLGAPDDFDLRLAHVTARQLLDPAEADDPDSVQFHHALTLQVLLGRILQRDQRKMRALVDDAARRLYGEEAAAAFAETAPVSA